VPRRQKISPSALRADDLIPPLYSADEGVAISIALSTVSEYLGEAALLQTRMARAHRRIRDGHARRMSGGDRRSLDADRGLGRRKRGFPFQAAHFYATCWTIIGKHLMTLRDISRLPQVGRALRPHLALFRQYASVRDHYEHFDERLPGRKNSTRLRVANDLGNLVGNKLSIGGDVVDMGPSSMQLLREIVREVLGAFKQEAIGRLMWEQPEQLTRLVDDARLLRWLRKSRKLWATEIATSRGPL
jgi:hypothetical protein